MRERAFLKACSGLTGKLIPSSEDLRDKDMVSMLECERMSFIIEQEQNELDDRSLMMTNIAAYKAILDDFAALYGPKLQLKSLLVGAIINLCAAVEVFQKDLWIAALNHGPKHFFERAAKQQGQWKTVDLEHINDAEYDVVNKLGWLLVAAKRYKFDSMKETADAYVAAFGKSAYSVMNPKGRDYSDVLVLDAARNLLLHAQGFADKDFRLKVERANSPSFPGLRDLANGAELPITGGFTKAHAESAMRYCTSLLKFVDACITKVSNHEHEPGTDSQSP